MSVDPINPSHMQTWVEAINQALQRYSEKDWNYSRIRVEVCLLADCHSPYLLEVDWLDLKGKQGLAAFKTLQGEITWGERHSHELGILEIISLRINRALLEVTSDAHWNGIRPVFRLAKHDDLSKQGRTHAFWYGVEEVAGEAFENR